MQCHEGLHGRLRIDQSRSRNKTGQEVKSVPIRSSPETMGSANYWSDKTFYRGASEQKAKDDDANNSSYIIE